MVGGWGYNNWDRPVARACLRQRQAVPLQAALPQGPRARVVGNKNAVRVIDLSTQIETRHHSDHNTAERWGSLHQSGPSNSIAKDRCAKRGTAFLSFDAELWSTSSRVTGVGMGVRRRWVCPGTPCHSAWACPDTSHVLSQPRAQRTLPTFLNLQAFSQPPYPDPHPAHAPVPPLKVYPGLPTYHPMSAPSQPTFYLDITKWRVPHPCRVATAQGYWAPPAQCRTVGWGPRAGLSSVGVGEGVRAGS